MLLTTRSENEGALRREVLGNYDRRGAESAEGMHTGGRLSVARSHFVPEEGPSPVCPSSAPSAPLRLCGRSWQPVPTEGRIVGRSQYREGDIGDIPDGSLLRTRNRGYSLYITMASRRPGVGHAGEAVRSRQTSSAGLSVTPHPARAST